MVGVNARDTIRVMRVLRWLLVLAFSVVADLANPALPGAVEALAETEDAIHLSAPRRPVELQQNEDRTAAGRAEAATAARVASFLRRVARPAGATPGRDARKAPPPRFADGPSAPEDH